MPLIVGKGVKELQNECNAVQNDECNVNITSIGISTFSSIVGSERLETDYNIAELKKEHHCTQNDTLRYLDNGSNLKNRFILNENNTHFIFADGETGSGTDLRKHFFHSFQVPRANLVCGGWKKTLSFLSESIKKGIPCILVEGSGGLADELASLLKMTRDMDEKSVVSDLQLLVDQTLSPQLKSLSKDVVNCLMHKNFFVICSSNAFRKEAIQHLLLDSYMMKREFKRSEVLELSHSWNCLKQATQALGSLEQYLTEKELVSCFLKFVQSGSTRFVDLVLSHKPNIATLLLKEDFIQLYQSDMIAYNFVQKFIDSQQSVNGLHELAGHISQMITPDSSTTPTFDKPRLTRETEASRPRAPIDTRFECKAEISSIEPVEFVADDDYDVKLVVKIELDPRQLRAGIAALAIRPPSSASSGTGEPAAAAPGPSSQSWGVRTAGLSRIPEGGLGPADPPR